MPDKEQSNDLFSRPGLSEGLPREVMVSSLGEIGLQWLDEPGRAERLALLARSLKIIADMAGLDELTLEEALSTYRFLHE
ncbi:hypothetical protein BH23PAT1_BH23PAT1_0380 [soil metagenome]